MYVESLHSDFQEKTRNHIMCVNAHWWRWARPKRQRHNFYLLPGKTTCTVQHVMQTETLTHFDKTNFIAAIPLLTCVVYERYSYTTMYTIHAAGTNLVLKKHLSLLHLMPGYSYSQYKSCSTAMDYTTIANSMFHSLVKTC